MSEPLREFEFLPNLPKSDLDDRSFEDLVRECILRIPRYCPEWTNHNPGDPGITMIELFAWLTKQMLYRFNQVPRRNYVAFLELLGIRLRPPTPARTELTFYLTRSHNSRQISRTNNSQVIRTGTEVATVRTETEEAVIFSTDRDLVIGIPQIKHLLLASAAGDKPTAEELNNPFHNTRYEQERNWQNLEQEISLFQECELGNCFYLVLEPALLSDTSPTDNSTDSSSVENAIAGNILALTFTGPIGVTTGIRPEDPPLQWEAWNGKTWQKGILRRSQDDQTKGFSFDQIGRQGGPHPEREGADVMLHLPQNWAEAEFGGYRGYWIRCTFIEHRDEQYNYTRSPQITGVTVRSVGGTIDASECTKVKEEFLGISNGRPGQIFALEGRPVLSRMPDEEHIKVRLPDGSEQPWEEVKDFGNSGPEQHHYLLDSLSGTVQFGPLIREPSQIQQQTREREYLQAWGKQNRRRVGLGDEAIATPPLPAILDTEDHRQERQYGQVPPLGAEIWITAYRVGGGSKGNVKAETLTVLKTAIPYVKRVVNYREAKGGTEAESLDEAVMRVPYILRTRKTALTPEDFERLAIEMEGSQSVCRAHCITHPEHTTPGIVRILIVPDIPDDGTADDIGTADLSQGMAPERFRLESDLHQALKSYIDDHKSLGIQVKLEEPTYVGIQVMADVLLVPQYRNQRNQRDEEFWATRLKAILYRFLNPLTGGFDGTGWPLGQPVRKTDVIAFLQDVPAVSYVGDVQLFAIHRHRQGDGTIWFREPAPEDTIELGDFGIACSWATFDNPHLTTAHVIEFLH
ncbi:MAG: putative baseplate assembly protein [Elainellaceae cyanobacterium]